MKKVFSLLLCLIMVVTLFSIPAGASDESASTVQPRFTYIATTSVGCGITTDDKVLSSASLDANPNYVDKVTITIYMQRRPKGSSASWTVIGVYSSSDPFAAEVEGKKDYVSGYEYRTYAMFTAYGSDGGIETTYNYSRVAS